MVSPTDDSWTGVATSSRTAGQQLPPELHASATFRVNESTAVSRRPGATDSTDRRDARSGRMAEKEAQSRTLRPRFIETNQRHSSKNAILTDTNYRSLFYVRR